MPPFADEYQRVIAPALRGIAGLSAEMYELGLARVLPQFQINHYAIQRATLPLLRFAIDRLQRFEQTEFVVQLREHFAEKIPEEKGHDEILLKDLARLGVPADEARQHVPCAAITAMIGSQYYLIEHHHPAALVGYAGLLEFPQGPPSREQVANLIARSGVDPKAFSNYKLHVQLDGDHFHEVAEMLNAFPEEPTLRTLVLTNSIRSGEFICQFMETVLADARSRLNRETAVVAEPGRQIVLAG